MHIVHCFVESTRRRKLPFATAQQYVVEKAVFRTVFEIIRGQIFKNHSHQFWIDELRAANLPFAAVLVGV